MTPSERRNLLMLTGVGLASMPAVLGLAGFTNMLLRSRKFRKDLASAPDSERRTLKELEEDGTIPKGSKILHEVDEIARTANESDRRLVKNPFKRWYSRVWLNPLLARSVRSGNNALFMGDSGGKPVLAFPDGPVMRQMVAHELGHHRAARLRKSVDDYMLEYDSAPRGRLVDLFHPGKLRTSDGRLTQVGMENEAWDLAGVPEDDRLRQSALGTYKALSLYNSLRKAGILSSAAGLGVMLYALKKYPKTWYGGAKEAEEKKAASADIEAKARLHYPAEGSHGWNHIQDVLANARRMRRRELRRNELAAIMYHDSSLMTGGRDTHAEDSAAIARKELAGLFRKRQLADIVNAIAHHRASYEGARSSRLEDLVAAADRPVPDLAKQVARSWKYHEELGEPEGLRAENVASHLKEKYGHGGYAYGNAPRLYLKTYGRELRDIMSKFDGLTPESVAAIMSGAEKKASARIDIPSVYDEVRKAYADMGYPIAGDRLVLSTQPTYTNGKPVPADVMRPEVSGGNTQDDGTVRINPNYRSVMKHWGLKGSGRDFLRLIIGHELGHHVDHTLLRTRARSAERRRLLREIARTGFHTGYTDSYGPDTDPRKLDKELLAEYLAKKVTARLAGAARSQGAPHLQ